MILAVIWSKKILIKLHFQEFKIRTFLDKNTNYKFYLHFYIINVKSVIAQDVDLRNAICKKE